VEPQYSNWAPGLNVASTNLIFPPGSDDDTSSYGVFRIAVNPLFQPFVSNNPGWVSATKRLTSPYLYDPATVIGRSSPFLVGSSNDTVGVPVGTEGTIVSNGSFTLIPAHFPSPPGTFEVKTEIRSLNMTGGGAAVQAGIVAPGTPGSFGEVNSLAAAGTDPFWSFPAKSFFDVFVKVTIPLGGPYPTIIVTNGRPLVVQQNSITNFPPKVIYNHMITHATPMMFAANYPQLGTNAIAGKTFGVLLLAGHGIGFSTNNSADLERFIQVVGTFVECPVDPQYASWAPGLNVPLQFTTVTFLNGNVQFNGYCSPTAQLVLQSSPVLVNPVWSFIETTPPTTLGTFNCSAAVPSRPLFYRMIDLSR